MIRKLIQISRHVEMKFFDGPALFNYPGREIKGYRSVNLMVYHWVHAFSASHFTQAGRILLLLTGYIFLGGMLTLLMPIYFLSITLSALFFIDVTVGWFLRPRLEVQRFLPESVAANSLFRVDYVIQNNSASTALDVYVDTIPFRKSIRLIRGRLFLGSLGPHESVKLSNELLSGNRGQFRLPLPVADSAFPFGLWRWGSMGAPNKPLLVFPKYTVLDNLYLPEEHSDQSSGTMSFFHVAGQSMDFLGCREFRYGDNPRYIHALSWARLRQPVVKEFSEEHSRHIILFVDTFTAEISPWLKPFKKQDNQFEASLSLAAATADYLIRSDYRIDLYTNGPDGITMKTDPRFGQLPEILEIFAALTDHPKGVFMDISTDVRAEISGVPVAVVFLLGWDDDRRQFVRSLWEAGIAVKTVCVTAKKIAEELPEALVVNLTPDDIFSGKVKDL
jgi:uncharacterized protein (DUF58 family)